MGGPTKRKAPAAPLLVTRVKTKAKPSGVPESGATASAPSTPQVATTPADSNVSAALVNQAEVWKALPNSPTWDLYENVLKPLVSEELAHIQTLAAAEDTAGLQALSNTGLKAALDQAGSCTGLVTFAQLGLAKGLFFLSGLLSDVPFHALEHPDMPPCLGAIVRCYNHFFIDAASQQVKPEAILGFTTTCRVIAKDSLPEPGDFQVMDGAAFRLAWLYGYGQHMLSKATMEAKAWDALLGRWRQSSRTFVVKLELADKSVNDNRKKLQLDQNIKANASLQGLVGYKLVRMTAKVQEGLKADRKLCTVDAVFAELSKVAWSEDDKPKRSTVEVQLKVNNRVNDRCARLLTVLESHYGKGHCLASLQGLDMICQKTASKDDTASARFLEWSIEGFLVKQLRGELSGQDGAAAKSSSATAMLHVVVLQEGRDAVRNTTVHFLALRRMLLFAQAKLGMTFWKGWLEYHQVNPKGTTLQYGLELLHECPAPSYPHVWQREAWESMTCLFDGMAKDPMAAVLSSNVFAPAEVLFQHPGVKKVFNLGATLEKKQEQEAVVEVGLVKPVAEPVVSEPEVAPEPKSPEPPVSHGHMDESLSVEMLPEEPAVKENVPKFWQVKFPDLCLPDMLIETFSSSDDAVFDKLYLFACVRSSVTFVEQPATDLAHAVTAHLNTKFPDGRAKGRVLFLYDVKSWNDRCTEQQDPWKNLPSLDEDHLQKVVAATLGADAKNFQANDLFFVWDGRRLDSGAKIKKFINSHKGNPAMNKKKPLGPMFRLLYNNMEFEPRLGYAAGQRAKFRSLPDPLETVYSVFGSDASVPERERKHLNIDMVGGSRSLSIPDLKLRSAEQHGIKVTTATYQMMQKGMAVSTPVRADGEGDGDEGGEAADDADEGPAVWFPWTACEELSLEWLHMYSLEEGKRTVIVNYTPGFGQVELASLRKDISCMSIVANSTHRAILEQRLILTIMLEGLRGQTKLLRGRRVLSLERSIGGGHDRHLAALQASPGGTGSERADGLLSETQDNDEGTVDNGEEQDGEYEMSDAGSLPG
ncbi:Nek5 [Symbiodinium sp. CCMP2592]|nr:Nek5 [Symbiodinium sp. CCMP2592]